MKRIKSGKPWVHTKDAPSEAHEPDHGEENLKDALEVVMAFDMRVPRDVNDLHGIDKKGAAAKVRNAKVTKAIITAGRYRDDLDGCVVGLDNGQVLLLHVPAVQRHMKELGRHKGPVTCMLDMSWRNAHPKFYGLVATGSADAQVKIWDPRVKATAASDSQLNCEVQTIPAHAGTVLCMAGVSQNLLTGGTDCKIRIWRLVAGREITVYPWLELHQELAEMPGWVTCLTVGATWKASQGHRQMLYAADDRGSVASFEAMKIHARDGSFELFFNDCAAFAPREGIGPGQAINPEHLGERGISVLQVYPDDGVLFALGNDNTCRVFNVSDTDHPPKLMASIENPNRCRYSAVALEQENDRVYLCDIKGHMVVYSLAEDKVVLQMDVSPTQKRIVGMEWGDEAQRKMEEGGEKRGEKGKAGADDEGSKGDGAGGAKEGPAEGAAAEGAAADGVTMTGSAREGPDAGPGPFPEKELTAAGLVQGPGGEGEGEEEEELVAGDEGMSSKRSSGGADLGSAMMGLARRESRRLLDELRGEVRSREAERERERRRSDGVTTFEDLLRHGSHKGRDWERRDAAGTSASEAGVSGMESEEVASDAEAQPGSRARGRLRDVARLLSGKDLGGFRNDVQLTVLAQTVTGVREEAVRLKKSARFFRQRRTPVFVGATIPDEVAKKPPQRVPPPPREVEGNVRELYVYVADKVQVLRVVRDHQFAVLRSQHTGPVVAICTGQGGPGDGLGAHVGEADFRIFTASHDMTVRLWDPFDMGCVQTLAEGRSEIASMTYFRPRNVLVTGHHDGVIKLWNVDTGSTAFLKGHHRPVTGMCTAAMTPGALEASLVTVSADGFMAIWGVPSQQSRKPHMEDKIHAHPGAEATCVAFVEAERMLATGDSEGVVKLWYLGTCDYLGTHRAHDAAVTALCVVPGRDADEHTGAPAERSLVVTASEDATLRVFDVTPPRWVRGRSMPFDNATPRSVLRRHRGPVTAAASVPLSGHVLSAGADGQLCVWDARRGVCLRTTRRKEEILCAALRYDVSEVVIGTKSGSVLRCPLGERVTAQQWAREAAQGVLHSFKGSRNRSPSPSMGHRKDEAPWPGPTASAVQPYVGNVAELPLSRGSTPARANSWVRALNKLSQRQLSVRAGEGWHITTEGRLAARGVRTTSGKSQNDEAISEESEGEEGTRDGADVDGDGKADGHVTVWLSEAAKEELKRMGQRPGSPGSRPGSVSPSRRRAPLQAIPGTTAARQSDRTSSKSRDSRPPTRERLRLMAGWLGKFQPDWSKL